MQSSRWPTSARQSSRGPTSKGPSSRRPTTWSFAFWLRYLPRHEWLGTGFLIFFLLVSIWSGVTFYRLARATLCGHDPTTAGSGPELPAVLVGIIVTLGITASAINGSNPLQWAGYSTNASLRQADVSTKHANWSGETENIGLIEGGRPPGQRFAICQWSRGLSSEGRF